MTTKGHDHDLETCGFPRCRSTEINCVVQHPNNPQLQRALCARHWEAYHLTQEPGARAALVLRIFGRKVKGVRS